MAQRTLSDGLTRAQKLGSRLYPPADATPAPGERRGAARLSLCAHCGQPFRKLGATLICGEVCGRARKRERDQEWRKANPEKYREGNLRWRKANLERVRERDRSYSREKLRRWREANPEKLRRWRKVNSEKLRRWRKANREKLREYERRWREANPEKVREYVRRWRETNLEKVRKNNRRHNAKMMLHREMLKRAFGVDVTYGKDQNTLRRVLTKMSRNGFFKTESST